jgi:peptide/nickel transport system substrate-binding protein
VSASVSKCNTRVVATLAALGLVALAATSCARARRTPDDALVLLIDNEVPEVDPRYELSAAQNKISRLCAAGLTAVDTVDMVPRMLLAASATAIDPLTWEIVLRPQARFPDGSPVTGDDVAFTYGSMLDPKLESPKRKSWLERFVSVDAVPGDPSRVRFHLKQPIATFLSDIDFGIVSKRAALAAGHGGRFAGGFTYGAGAYRPVSIRPGEVILESNPYYVEGAPPLRRVIVRTVRDANARLLMLVGGSADFTQNTVRMDLLDEVAKRPRLRTQTGASAILSYVLFQNDDPILKDVRVRRAITLAVDRDKLIRGKLGGHAVRATGILPPSHWAYNGDVPRYDYDPAAARKLLDQAGYPDPDGPGGRPRFSLTYKTSSDLFRISLARLIAQQLAEVGIDVQVRPFEFATLLADLRAGNFQLASLQTSEIVEPDMHWVYFHSSRIPTKDQPDNLNRIRYRNPEADKLIEAGRYELDLDKRKAIYGRLQRIIADDAPLLPLWHEDNVAVQNRDVLGYVVVPNARLTAISSVRKRAPAK